MADSYATLEAERVRLHGRRITARVVIVDGALAIMVKDSRITGERESAVQAGAWVTFADAAASQVVYA